VAQPKPALSLAPFGVFADTGLPLETLDTAAVKALVTGDEAPPLPPDLLASKAHDASPHFGTIGDVDPKLLNEAGWAVLFGPRVDRRIREALQPLLDHRKAQVGDAQLYRVFEADSGFQPGDTAVSWLARHNVRLDVVDPLLGVPFYILIVASPDEIPYEFQYSLDLYWGVGRLWFD